ncbi:MAG: N-acetylglucosamine kinase [Cyclobacteriaceae bacterium]
MGDSSFIVGDAGGTKTQWRVFREGKISQFSTIGFNAYTHNLEDLRESIAQNLSDELTVATPVYLYAAGVDTEEQKLEVENALREVLGQKLKVRNDLVGASRALCGDKPGNVCILGTGANACYYDGSTVNKVSASLGYVLGDEGSGAYLGKKLMMGVFREQISKDVIDAFQEEFNLTSHKVIQQIYHKPRPNHFLASFAPFVLKHKSNPEIYRLIYDAFVDFHHAFFFRNEHASEALHFSGSIAYHFSDVLRQVGLDKEFEIKNIVESPIAGLVLYHQDHG